MFGRLISYLDSIKCARSGAAVAWEVLLYPGLWAFGYHRLAHWLFRWRMVFSRAARQSLRSRFLTAIDIHPGADRQTSVYRSWLYRDRRNRRDRRQCHDLSMRHVGRHQPRQWHRGQAPSDDRGPRHDRIGRADTRPDHGRQGRADRRQRGGHQGRPRRRDDGRHPGAPDAGRRRRRQADFVRLWHAVQRARSIRRRKSSNSMRCELETMHKQIDALIAEQRGCMRDRA